MSSQVRDGQVNYRNLSSHDFDSAYDDFETPSVERLRSKGSRETNRSLEARRRVAKQVGGMQRRHNKHGI